MMWIIITLMTHAHMECNLKAIMGSLTFSIQSSPRVGVECHAVSPETVANGNINKMLINHREGTKLTGRSGRVNILIEGLVFWRRQEFVRRFGRNITLRMSAVCLQTDFPTSLTEYTLCCIFHMCEKHSAVYINSNTDAHTQVHTHMHAEAQAFPSSFATGCCFPAV